MTHKYPLFMADNLVIANCMVGVDLFRTSQTEIPSVWLSLPSAAQRPFQTTA